mgnify:CR=1 FL=1
MLFPDRERPRRRVSVEKLFIFSILLGAALGQNQNAQNQSATVPNQTQKTQLPTAQSHKSKTDPELQAIIAAAETVPPEFGADVMIRLAESSKVTTSGAKVTLLTKAFNLAAGAELPVKRAGGGPGGNMFDARSAMLARAYRLNLDKVSLQARAVIDLLPLNSARAREMFDQIQIPALAPVGCQERLTYDLDLFYQALAKIVRAGLPPRDKEKGRAITLLSPFVSGLQSHAQVKPVAELLVEAQLSPADLAQLSNTFAGVLLQLHGDERSFAAGTMGPGASTSGAIADLVAALDEKQVSSAILLRSYRQYLVSNFGDVHCAGGRGQGDANSLPGSIRNFNQRFQHDLQAGQIAPIAADELKNSRIVAPPAATPYWQSAEGKKLMTELRNLRAGSPEETGENESDTPEKTNSTPSSQLTDFLTEIEAWQPQDDPPADVFHEKSILYQGLMDLAPTPPQRLQVINSFVSFMELYSGQLPTRIEWLLPADDLLAGRRAATDRQEVIQAFLNSGDPTLSLYARLERLDPRKTSTEQSGASHSEK